MGPLSFSRRCARRAPASGPRHAGAADPFFAVRYQEQLMSREGFSGLKIRVLFLFTHTSARSQMAEGLLRHLVGDRFEVASAGTQARGVNPLAVPAMAEAGVDLSGQSSKTLERFLEERWDYVVTVCDSAN